MFKDDVEFLVIEEGCQICANREPKCDSEKCQQYSPFTCGNSENGLMSVYCNPDEDNCLSFNDADGLDLRSHNANFSYFGCVKKPDDIENRSRYFGIECLKFCGQKNKIMALMRPGFEGNKKGQKKTKLKKTKLKDFCSRFLHLYE